MAIAGTMISADSVRMAKSDPPAGSRNLGSFLEAISDSGLGFVGPICYHLPHGRNCVSFEDAFQLVRHSRRYLGVCDSAGDSMECVESSAHFESSLRVIAYSISA